MRKYFIKTFFLPAGGLFTLSQQYITRLNIDSLEKILPTTKNREWLNTRNLQINHSSFLISVTRKFRYFKSFFLACCFFMPGLLLSQPSSIKFEYLTTNDGLSHNNVCCMLQDKQGYMWFGTTYGLNSYDGYGFKVFKNIPGDSTTIAHNMITSLCEDKNGFIWVGGPSALCSYNPRTETFKNYPLIIPTQQIHDIKEDDNELLWLATGMGLFSFDSKTYQQIRYATAGSAPRLYY